MSQNNEYEWVLVKKHHSNNNSSGGGDESKAITGYIHISQIDESSL